MVGERKLNMSSHTGRAPAEEGFERQLAVVPEAWRPMNAAIAGVVRKSPW